MDDKLEIHGVQLIQLHHLHIIHQQPLNMPRLVDGKVRRNQNERNKEDKCVAEETAVRCQGQQSVMLSPNDLLQERMPRWFCWNLMRLWGIEEHHALAKKTGKPS